MQPESVTDLMDTATASYIDTVTGIPVPGETRPMASAPDPARHADQHHGNRHRHRVDQRQRAAVLGRQHGHRQRRWQLHGQWFAGYTLGTKLDKDSFDLLWTSVTRRHPHCTDPEGCAVGFVEINKTVYVDPVPAITTGTLSDTATLTASDGFTASSGPATIGISTNALVELTLVKTIPDILQDDETITCDFKVKDSPNTVGGNTFVRVHRRRDAGADDPHRSRARYLHGGRGRLRWSGTGRWQPTQTVDLTLPPGSTARRLCGHGDLHQHRR